MSVWHHVMITAAVLAGLQGISAEGQDSEQAKNAPPKSPGFLTHSSIKTDTHDLVINDEKVSPGNNNRVPLEHPHPEQQVLTIEEKDIHTITSKDFAEKTASINAKQPEEQRAQITEISSSLNNSPTPDKKLTDIKINQGKLNKMPQVENGNENSRRNVDTDVHDTKRSDNPNQSELNTPNLKDELDTSNIKNTSIFDLDKFPQDNSLVDISNKISDDLKVYSNDVILSWSGKNVKVSWTAEATNVLKDYRDKIAISEAAYNTECVKKDLENYQVRTKTLDDIIKACEAGLKRIKWHELQDKTKGILSEISEIVQEATNAIDKLPKDSSDFKSNKDTLEKAAITRIQQLHIESYKETFSKLKEESIKTDEEDYKTCIDEKPERGMVVDTMNDIMRIKNNCVG